MSNDERSAADEPAVEHGSESVPAVPGDGAGSNDPAGDTPADVRKPVTKNYTGPVPPAVTATAAWSWRLIVIVAAVALVAFALVQVKTVVIPVLVAALLTSLLSPVTNWLHRRVGLPRVLAVVGTLLLVVLVLGGLLTLAGTSLVRGFSDLAETAWDGIETGIAWLSSGPLGLSEETINSYLATLQDQLSSNIDSILSGAVSVTTSVGHVLAGALIAMFCLFFFLKEGETIWGWIVRLFPRVARDRVSGAGIRGWVSLSVYARTQIVVAFIDGVGIGLGAWLLGVPLALPLGVLVFLGSFIPIVGAVLTGAVAVAVALVDQGPFRALIMLAVVLGVQQLESHLFQPMLMSRALKLHPVAVLLAVATGTLIGGIVGALFAVPVVAVVNAVMNFLYHPTRDDPALLKEPATT
ncbi:AI-2E family transporter [Occultella glacieicola]|uniref:AI-2E family transporter n=1 Tax=Occultella glacieicola TaxID=2518684 RepID=A0ABY2E376_9MICO|nr:AI-2E family transporter [Occultella glacieicola]TDE93940.1 AI-2E family transporter [Occultella glacieicola]